jgi:L-fuconolactonase
MMLVDAHCHVGKNWYEPPSTLDFLMRQVGVDHAVLVAMTGSSDLEYLLAAQDEYGADRFSLVMWIDLESKDWAESMRAAVLSGAQGLRIRARSLLAHADRDGVTRTIAQIGKPISVISTVRDLDDDELADSLRACGDAQILLEHLGASTRPPEDQEDVAARARVFRLSGNDHVNLKFHGLGELLAGVQKDNPSSPFASPTHELLRQGLDAFGPSRMLFGSSFPRVCHNEGYGNSIRLARKAFEGVSEGDVQLMFGGNAMRIYGLNGR